MIRTISVRNFKSLKAFRLDLNHNTALVGLNGAGKSTFLQALSFLSAAMSGTVKEWLSTRTWDKAELHGGLPPGDADALMTFSVDLEVSTGFLRWEGVCDTTLNDVRCIKEVVVHSSTPGFDPADSRIVWSQDGKSFRGHGQPLMEIAQGYQGSLLSSLFENLLPAECVELKKCLAGIRSLDLLSSSDLRAPAKLNASAPDRDVGVRGERIAAFLHHQSEEWIHEKLVLQLQKFFPNVTGLRTGFVAHNMVQLYVRERFDGHELEIPSTHCPDGLLRVLALLAEMRCADGLLCLDEIENGLCMDVLDKLMRSLPKMRRQILFTTQSVIALNYVAREDVRILYRDRLGGTRSGLLADLKENRKYIDFYEEPGDALYFTSLVKASAELRDGLKTGDDVTV